MKFTILLISLSLSGCLAVDPAGIRPVEAKRTPADIFGFLDTDNDWTDVLYVCDFFKTFSYSCNVTLQGAEYLKNSSTKSPSKVSGQKRPKFAILNVTGSWSQADGLMKEHLSTLDDLDNVAKCLFRTSFYECFGVPVCDGHGGMSPCHGGEPWRGQYSGAPNIGFSGNITNMAMESPPMQPDTDVSPSGMSNQPLIGASSASDGLSGAPVDLPESGRTLVTITNSSGTFTSSGTGNFNGTVEIPANGSISIMQVSPISDKDGTQAGGVQVSSFASFSSGNNNGGAVAPVSFSTDGGFGGMDFSGLPRGPRRQRPSLPFPVDSNQTTDGFDLGSNNNFAGPSSSSNCSGDQAQSVRCLVQNFQRNLFQSLMSSFQSPNFQPFRFNVNPSLMPFGRMMQSQPMMDPMFQAQSMGPMFQSQSMAPQGRAFSPRFGGFKILVVPDNTPQAGPRSDEDDMSTFLNYEKK